MVSILGANSVSGGYEVSNSLRFNDDDSPQLSKDMSGLSATNTKKFTTSFWFKMGNVPQPNYSGFIDVGGDNALALYSDNTFYYYENGGSNLYWRPTRVFRDPSAWYNIIIIADSTLSTQTDRVKIYVNGVKETSFHNNSGPSQNYDFSYNTNNTRNIGRSSLTSSSLDGYLSEMHHIDGQAKAHTDFGEFDNNGVWVPIKYTGTYGNTGYYLEYKQTGTSQNSSGIGADTSGEDNHFAVSNLAATDINVDTCTNNWCTLNPLDTPTSGSTFSEGNLKITTSSGQQGFTRSTIAVSQGKWYFETKITTGNVREAVGIALTEATLTDTTKAVHYYSRYGHVLKGNSLFSTKATFGDNDKIGVAFNLDDNTVAFYKNGSLQDTVTSIDSGTYSPIFRDGSDAYAGGGVLNFGNNGTFAGTETAQGNSDGNGYGDFYYSVPSGYYALNTKNLAEFG